MHLGPVSEGVDEHVTGRHAVIGGQPVRDALDGIGVQLGVPLVPPNVVRDVVVRVEYGIQGVDALDVDLTATRKCQVELSPLEAFREDSQDGRPGPHADARTGRRQRLHDGPPITAVVAHSRHEGALSTQIDGQHGAARSPVAVG